jgi:hypothetical protein
MLTLLHLAHTTVDLVSSLNSRLDVGCDFGFCFGQSESTEGLDQVWLLVLVFGFDAGIVVPFSADPLFFLIAGVQE